MMKSVEILSNTDRTSWSRILMAARFYLAPVRWQLWAFPLLSLVCFLLITRVNAGTNPALYSLVASPLSLCVCFAPLAFGVRKGREVDAMLPVAGVEKCIVILLYCLVVVPLLVYVPVEVASYIKYGATYNSVAMASLPTEATDYVASLGFPLIMAVGIIGSAAYILTCLWGVFHARSRRVLGGFLAVVIYYVGFMLISVIVGIVAGVSAAMSEPDLAEINKEVLKERVLTEVMPLYMKSLLAVCSIYAIFALTMCCRAISRRQL